MRKLKYSKLLFPEKEKRPKCPRCGSSHVISRGIEWCCADCHRRWVKDVPKEVKERILKIKGEK